MKEKRKGSINSSIKVFFLILIFFFSIKGGGKAAAKHIHEYLEVGDCWKNIELEFSVIER